jgi:hypothetical protein
LKVLGLVTEGAAGEIRSIWEEKRLLISSELFLLVEIDLFQAERTGIPWAANKTKAIYEVSCSLALINESQKTFKVD